MTAFRRSLVVSIVIASVALAACSDDDNASSNTTAAPAETAGDTIAATGADGFVIEGFAFGAFAPTAGEAFEVMNRDGVPHTVTADDGTFTVRVDGGDTGELTVTDAGSYPIHCDIHPQMTGTLTVNG